MVFNTLIAQIPSLLSGLVITIELMICSLLLGVILAIFLTLNSYSKIKLVKYIIYVYTFIIRGTPLLVQIFIIYYGAGQFNFIKDSILWNVLKYPFGCAVITLALNSAGYCVILFRGMIEAIPKGEFEACTALGMTKFQMILSVIVKRFIQIVLPAYSNEVIIILKSTSLASTITLMDLMGVTREMASETYATIPYLVVAGVCYLIINLIIIKTFKSVENVLRIS